MPEPTGLFKTVASTLALSGLALARPSRAADAAIALPRSGPWVFAGFLIAGLLGSPPLTDTPAPWVLGDPRQALLLAPVWALCWYLLFYRLFDFSARFLGGESRHRELRWIGFFFLLPTVICELAATRLPPLTGAPMPLRIVVGLALAGWVGWIQIAMLLATARIYDFSVGRMLMTGSLIFFGATLLLAATLGVAAFVLGMELW